MVTAGEYSRNFPEGQISITPFESNEVPPPSPMPMMSEDFWEWALGFKGWNDWHYALPGGNFQLENLSNLIVKKVKRPVLICVRADHLADNTQQIYGNLKYACNKQFQDHRPGVIHMLVNTKLFGLGEKGSPSYVERSLIESAEELFRDYSRVWKVLFDIVTPPSPGKYLATLKRRVLTNGRCKPLPKNYQDPPPILLW